MPEAIQQLRDIRERIAWFGGDTNANRFTQHLMDVVTQADQFPLLGRPVPEFGSERVRDRLVDRYRLIYQVVPTASRSSPSSTARATSPNNSPAHSVLSS